MPPLWNFRASGATIVFGVCYRRLRDTVFALGGLFWSNTSLLNVHMVHSSILMAESGLLYSLWTRPYDSTLKLCCLFQEGDPCYHSTSMILQAVWDVPDNITARRSCKARHGPSHTAARVTCRPESPQSMKLLSVGQRYLTSSMLWFVYCTNLVWSVLILSAYSRSCGTTFWAHTGLESIMIEFSSHLYLHRDIKTRCRHGMTGMGVFRIGLQSGLPASDQRQ